MKGLLNRISKEGFVVDIKDGKLKVYATKESFDRSIIDEIKKNETAILNHLKALKGLSISKKTYHEIPKSEESSSYPVLKSQIPIWLACQTKEGSIAYSIPNSIILERPYDLNCFQKAVESVIERHETLRTIFKIDEFGELKQFVLANEEFHFKIDLKDFREYENPQSIADDYMRLDYNQPFDLLRGPLLRIALLKISDTQSIFYYNLHHIICDGWSMNVLHRDVMTYYEAYVTNTTPNISPLRIQYKDYAKWVLSLIDSTTYNKHKDYWISQFSEEIPRIDLPSQIIRPQIKTYKGEGFGQHIPKGITSKLRHFSEKKGGSLFMGLLAVWKVLLYRYTGETDIVVGNMSTGREHPDQENQIGFYINALALRNRINPEDKFETFYEKIRVNTFNAYKHQMYSLNDLTDDLDISRDASRNALFEIVINYHGISEDGKSFSNFERLGDYYVKFDLVFDIIEVNEGINLLIKYNSQVYEKKLIKDLMNHFQNLLIKFLDDPSLSIGSVNFLSTIEQNQILGFNSAILPVVHYENNIKNVIDLFTSKVTSNPDAVALLFEGNSLTYKELDIKSNKLARYLQELGVTKETLVPISIEPSFNMIIGMLAILKSGGVYVPIDTNCPEQRLTFILEDIDCSLLLTDSSMALTFEQYEDDMQVIYTDKSENELARFSSTSLNLSIDVNQLAYIIYTSGTTGVPKGVMIEHKSIFHYIKNQTQFFDVNKADTFLLFSNVAFDASIEQILLAILNGAKLVVPKKSDLLDNQKFNSLLSHNSVTHLHAVPSFFRAINLKSSYDLKRIVSAGEIFDMSAFNEVAEDVSIYNKYGPTEMTISATQYKVEKGNYNSNSIGKPIDNTSCYILDKRNNLLPVGVIGEICISGLGITRGYLNRENLTSKQIIDHPFIEGERMYKTGDLGCWLPDGSIAFRGRLDYQVKIRGYRVELEEISSVLNELYNIQQAIVTAVDDQNGVKRLVAYITSSELADSNSIKEGLTLLLEEKLPKYMIPDIYMKLDEMPLNANGKINRKELPIPDIFNSRKEYEAPSNEIEIKLTSIWGEVLKINKIGVNDSFFDIGGHSLAAIRLSFEVFKEYEIKLEISIIFQYPTIKLQAQYIDVIQTNNNQEEVGDDQTIYI